MIIILKAAAAELGLPSTLIESITDKELSGDAALTQVMQNKEYKLIITDLSMPMMDGYETTKKIRQYIAARGQAQPVIIACTGHTEQAFIDKAWRHEMNEFLSKPLNI